jgi:hypothetical protein
MKLNTSSILTLTLGFAGSALFLLSCQTTHVAKIKPTSPTFSVYSGKTDPLMCNVQGDMEGCKADWTITAGILTHRQVCNTPNRKYIKPMLNAMARTLNESCALKIKYARLTTKDDSMEEQRLAKMMSQSKLWNQYSKSSKQNPSSKKLSSFPEKFIRKVVEVKGIFSEVTEALNANGFDFAVEKVEVTKLNSLTQSRHFQTLKQVQTQDNFMVPENIRIVWINKGFEEGQPERIKVPQNTRSTQGLSNKLPSKKSFN